MVSIQQPNAVAYQAPTPAPAAGVTSALAVPAQTLPEANYVTFVVTTMVKQTDVASATAASGVAASASKRNNGEINQSAKKTETRQKPVQITAKNRLMLKPLYGRELLNH